MARQTEPTSPTPPVVWSPQAPTDPMRRYTVTVAIFANMASLSPSTIRTYHSRGGILPKPVGYRGRRPIWLTTDVIAWIGNSLPAEKIEPLRLKEGRK